MTTRGVLYVVFVLPVLFSVVFGTVVMADVLQKPDRELDMWRFAEDKSDAHKSIEIIGMEKQYSTSQAISLDVRVSDSLFSCGDLYITIYSEDGQAITQSGFFQQCFSPNDPILPIGAKFSEIVDVPGVYKLVVELTDKNQRDSIITNKTFTVK